MAQRPSREPVAEPLSSSPGDARTDRRSADVLAFPSLGVRREAVTRTTPEPRLRSVLGEVLRDERHDQERTLADVAESAAVSVPYLSEVERGTKEVSSELLAAICDALDLDLPDLLDRSARRLRSRARAASGPVALLAA